MRNFGVPSVTARGIVGGVDQSRGPHNGDDTHADSNVLQFRLADRAPSRADRLNSDGFDCQLFIQDEQSVIEPYELGSGVLFLFVVLAPVAIVSGMVLGYLLFVA